MSAFWLWPYLFAAGVVYGGNWAFRTVARGFTQVRAERAIRRYTASLRRITEEVR